MQSSAYALMEAVRAHETLILLVVFALAFGESLAVVSVFLPATALLAGGAGITSAAGMNFWMPWLAATAGAAAGDWVSYVLGFRFGPAVASAWPLSRRPELLIRGRAFFERWGIASVFLGRFFGPLRCIVPLIAGICAMPFIPFQISNILSAALWAAGVLAPGHLAVMWFVS